MTKTYVQCIEFDIVKGGFQSNAYSGHDDRSISETSQTLPLPASLAGYYMYNTNNTLVSCLKLCTTATYLATVAIFLRTMLYSTPTRLMDEQNNSLTNDKIGVLACYISLVSQSGENVDLKFSASYCTVVELAGWLASYTDEVSR